MDNRGQGKPEDVALFIPTRNVVREVLGPVSVLASPVYNADEDTYLVFGALPNGSPVAIEELAQAQKADGSPVSLFQHIYPGDVIICAAATRTDSIGHLAKCPRSWSGRYQVADEVYKLENGKAIDLVVKMYEELDHIVEKASIVQ